MWLIAATVTGSKMYIMLDQYASSQQLKQFTLSADTTLFGKSFHRSTTLKLKKLVSQVQPGVLLLQFQGVSSGPGAGVSNKRSLCLIDTMEIFEYFNNTPHLKYMHGSFKQHIHCL